MIHLTPEFRHATPAVLPTVEAVLARGPCCRALLARLGHDDAPTQARLRMVASPACVVVLGPSEHLPWVDGLLHLARHPDEPNLWLPTTTMLDVDASALLRAFLALPSAPRPPLALDPDTRTCVSLAAAIPLTPAVLTVAARVALA